MADSQESFALRIAGSKKRLGWAFITVSILNDILAFWLKWWPYDLVFLLGGIWYLVSDEKSEEK